MEIEIRLLEKGEEEKVNDLFNLTYHHKRPLENFMWEFFSGPNGKAIYVVAVDKEKQKIIGTQSAIPIEFISGDGEKILTAKSEDTLLDPDYRGMGVFDKMYKMLFKACEEAGIKYIWGFTYAKKPFLKVGFEIPFDTIQGVCTLKPGKAFAYLAGLNPSNKLLDKLKIFALSYASYFFGSLKSRQGVRSMPDLRENESHDAAGFIKDAISKKGSQWWTINFSENYLRWRIIENPYHNKYAHLVLRKDQVQLADVIANSREQEFAYLEQMFFSDAMKDSEKKEVIVNIIQRLRAEGNFLVRFWGFDHNEINAAEVDLLKQCGFTFVRKGTSFVWKNLQAVKGQEINPSQLVLSRMFTQGNS